MICPSCGKDNVQPSKFCMFCGAPMETAQPPAAQPVAASPQPQAPGGAYQSDLAPMGLSGLLAASKEKESGDAFILQNKKLLKVNMNACGGVVMAKAGSMVAYQGQMNFARKGGGVDKWLKKKISGEQFTLMEVTGTGDLFLADAANDIVLLYLNNESLQVESHNLLAFTPSLSWDITMIKGASGVLTGAGMWTVELRGTGYMALITKGEPVTLQVTPDQPTYTDPNATVAWSEGLNPQIHVDVNLKSLKGIFGSAHGEAFQLAFQGNGFVIVQPSEEAPKSSLQSSGGGGGGAGGILGGILGQ